MKAEPGLEYDMTNNPMQQMRAVVARGMDARDLADARVPYPDNPHGHDILVEIQAIAVNPVDIKVRSAHTGAERALGWDAAGVVVAVGDAVTLFQPGDEVYYAGAIDRPGSYAQYQLVEERIVAHKPKTLDFAQAAALPLTTITAWESVFDKLRLSADSAGTILVLGAAGGVGSILIQLVKQLTKLRVIATASRPESAEWVRKMGADIVLDHTAPDFAAQILQIVPGGVDYVFSAQSQGRMELFAEIMRPFGQIVAIDDSTGLDFMLLKPKAITWHWEYMFARARYGFDMQHQHDLLQRVAELVDAGELKTTLNRSYQGITAENIRAAQEEIESGKVIGKIVIVA